MPATKDAIIAAIRRFNRFYTRIIGTLDEGVLQSPLSLTEGRVLYELATRQQPTASEIAADLGLDMGYLSRILRAFHTKKWLRRQISASDGRQSLLSLTAAGRQQFQRLDQNASEQVRQMIQTLTSEQQTQLLASMSSIETLLVSPIEKRPQPYILRSHQAGDIGWVIERHGAIYAEEYGWDQRFESLVARIAADFIDNLDPSCERCWIADRNGERLGCVFLVRDTESSHSSQTARLRLLLVEPSARGLGLGRTLVHQCTAFARSVGYRKIVLWTNSILDTARHIYQDEGYKLVSEKPYSNFGKELITQDWELNL